MGTAPDGKQQPAMPDAGRLVSRSVTVLQRLGYSRAAALAMVVQVSVQVHEVLADGDMGEYAWIAEVAQIAAAQLAGSRPSETE